MSGMPIRNAAELGRGDLVQTPAGRLAIVASVCAAGVELIYQDKGDKVSLPARLLTLERKAVRPPLSIHFFREARRHAGRE